MPDDRTSAQSLHSHQDTLRALSPSGDTFLSTGKRVTTSGERASPHSPGDTLPRTQLLVFSLRDTVYSKQENPRKEKKAMRLESYLEFSDLTVMKP